MSSPITPGIAAREAATPAGARLAATTLLSSCLSRGACGCAGHARTTRRWPERRSVAGHCRDGDVLVEAWRDHALRGGHVEGRRSCPFVRYGGVPAREDLGLRRSERVGLGRLRRRVHRRRNRGRRAAAGDDEEGAALHPERRLPDRRGRQGRDVRPAFQLRALSESEGPRRDLHRRLRQRADRAAARGHPAEQVLPAVLRLVPDAEVPLLPVRLVVEPVAGRSGAGRRRRQHQLRVQPVRDVRRRDHVAARAFAAPRASSPTGSAWTIA